MVVCNAVSYCNSEDKVPTFSFGIVKTGGDYQLLNQSVQEHRKVFRRAHLELGSSLHQLGEHHVRNKDYEKAMTAFTEALDLRCKASGFNPDEKIFNHQPPCIIPESEDKQKELDEMVSTISSMGNVHSLLGEHDEAMKCYTDIMTIRASFSNTYRGMQQTSLSCTSDLYDDEDNSEIVSESDINDDVEALDDLFRSISFRDSETKRFQPPPKNHMKSHSIIPHSNLIADPEIARSIPEEINTITSNISCPTDLSYHDIEIIEALEAYRDLLDNYSGEDIRLHQADYRQIIQEVNSLSEGLYQPDNMKNKCMRERNLYMAIIVYDRIRTAHQSTADSIAIKIAEDCGSVLEQQEASIKVASTMIRIGSLHYKLGNIDEELHMYNQALTTYTKALGEKHIYVAGTRKNIGMVLAEKADYNAAMEQFNKAQAIYSHISKGDMNDDVASALLCMGNVQSRRCEYDYALSLYSKALHIHRTLAEESSWSASSIQKLTSTLKIIGMVYAKRDDLPSAMRCFKEALDILEEEGSTESSNGIIIASIRTRMGGIYYRKGQYEDAMSQYQEAYKAASTSLGTTLHADVAGIMHYIGMVYQKRSNYEKAMSCYGKSVAIYRKTLGSNNPAVATTLVCIGSIHYRKRDLDKALEYYKEASCLYETAYGPHHPQVAPTLKSVAMIYTKKGDFNEAMDIFRTILKIKYEEVGSCHPEVANACKSIANIHMKRGELGEALRQYKYALNIYQRTVGENNSDAQLIKKDIARVRHRIAKERSSFVNNEQRDARPYKRRIISSSRFSY